MSEEAEKREKRKRNRAKAMGEIVSTEDSYVQGLEKLVNEYLLPLQIDASRSETTKLTLQQIQIVFSNIMTIKSLNEKFLEDLKIREQQWKEDEPTSQIIGDLFISFAHFFKMYTQYVNNHEQASRFLRQAAKDSKFEAFQTFLNQKAEQGGLDLNSFLIMPIQRIPRYKLLIQEVLRNTEDDHPDKSDLEKAMELVNDIALKINEAVRQQEQRDEILVISEKFTSDPDFVAPSRYLVRQGPLTKQCRASDKQYEFFLFNDMLAYANSIAFKYKLHRKLKIDAGFVVQDLPDRPEEKNNHRFQIVSAQKSFIVYAATEDLKKEWLKDLYACVAETKARIRNEDGSQFTAPVWAKDQSSNKCVCCNSSFTFFNRRHHCRYCGSLVCGSCSLCRMILPGQQQQLGAQRVCDLCVDSIRSSSAGEVEVAEDTSKRAGKHVRAPSMPPPKVPLESKTTTLPQPTIQEEQKKPVPPPKVKEIRTAPPIAKCKALFSYQSSHPQELTLTPGDIITVYKHFDDGWSEGVLNNVRGLFPLNYTEVVENLENKATVKPPSATKTTPTIVINTTAPSSVASTPKSATSDSSSSTVVTDDLSLEELEASTATRQRGVSMFKQVKVFAEYNATRPEELSIKPGQILTVLNEDDDGWATGLHLATNTQGWFPLTYTQPVDMPTTTHTHQTKAKTPTQQYCRAMFAYHPSGDGGNGKELELKEGDVLVLLRSDDSGWSKGTDKHGESGWFPTSYVQNISEEEAKAATDDADTSSPVSSPVTTSRTLPKPTAVKGPPKTAPSITAASTSASTSSSSASVSPGLAGLRSVAKSPKVATNGGSNSSSNSGGGASGACNDCSCASFRPNQFRPQICMDCRHNKTRHA